MSNKIRCPTVIRFQNSQPMSITDFPNWLHITVGLCAVGEFEILLPVAAAYYIINVKIKNKKMKKDFQPEQKLNNEPLPIDSTSSPNCTKPNVICSQSQTDILNEAKKIMLPFDKNLPFKEWFFILQMHLKNIDGFYEWFVETYKPKPKHFAIVRKMEDGFYIDMSQMRKLYYLMSSKPKLYSPPKLLCNGTYTIKKRP